MRKSQSVAHLSLALLVSLFSGCATESHQGVRSGTVAYAGLRLTVELRDGSRVAGTSKDNHCEFKSEILGKLKLPLQKVRFVESAGSTVNTNLVKLTTADGDTLAVKFVTKEIRMATTHGEVRLPVGLIKSLRVSAAGRIGRPKEGLVGLWSGEGNAVDSIGGNNGVLRNVSFTDGVVGRAFTFAPENFPDGTYTGVMIPDQPAYALTHSLTVDAWVRPRGAGCVVLFRGDHRPGLDPYTLSMQGKDTLLFQICGPKGDSDLANVETKLGYCVWTHVAAVLDGDAGMMILYTNGVMAAQAATRVRPFGELLPDMSPGLGIGNVNDGGNNFPFVGDLDEVGLYNRALSAEEVNAIYSENSAQAGGYAAPLPPRNAIPNKARPNLLTVR